VRQQCGMRPGSVGRIVPMAGCRIRAA